MLTRDEAFPYGREHCQAAKRAAADIEIHSEAAKFGEPGWLSLKRHGRPPREREPAGCRYLNAPMRRANWMCGRKAANNVIFSVLFKPILDPADYGDAIRREQGRRRQTK
jgi:hypothetical protein